MQRKRRNDRAETALATAGYRYSQECDAAAPATYSFVSAVEFGGFLISIFFIFVFYKNIFSIWKFTEIYPGRPPSSRAAGAFPQKNTKNNCRQVPGTGRPAAGRPALPPLYKDWLVPPPLICISTIPETKKNREGGREAKPCRIFEPATAGNQNSSTLYK